MDQLDPQAVALARSIKKTETGNDPNAYTAQGKSGEFGAYQFMPQTFKTYAQKYLGDANAQPSIENQNKIAYSYVKEKKDAGWNPAQILSGWNAGESEKDAYKGTFSNGQPSKGTNKMGVQYDVPSYVARGSQYYHEFSGGYQTQPNLPAPNQDEAKAMQKQLDEGPSLGEQLSNRAQDISQSAGQIAQGGVRNIAEGALGVAGGVAGGIGDVTNAALELVPGVKLVEKGVGGVLHTLLGAPGVRDVVSQVQQLAAEHPQLAKDVGNVVNIASVIPLFKGVGAAADAVKTAGAQALQGTLENAAKREINSVALQTVGGRKVLENASKRGLDPIGDVVKHGTPDVYVDSSGVARYDGTNGFMGLRNALDEREKSLQSMLETASPKGSLLTANKANLQQLRQQALREVDADFKNTGSSALARSKVNKIFDDYRSQYGDYINLSDLNDMKRGIRSKVNWKTPQLSADVRYTIGQTFMKDIERIATQQGMPEVAQINSEMASMLEAQKLLKLMDKKAVKLNPFEKAARGFGADVAGGIGEFAGGLTGIPFAGTLAGRAAGRGLLNREPGTVFRNLKRARTGGSARKAGQAVGGILAPTVLRTRAQGQDQVATSTP